ncbi:hypothetical protein H312_00249, partial [Anncaliia algerae PRA339]
MPFSNIYNIKTYNINSGKARKSNPRLRNLDDVSERKHLEKHKDLKTKKRSAEENNASSFVMFKRGMEARAIKRMLFMMEGDDEFERKSLRNKMTDVMRKSSKEVQENFYDLGIENKL